LSAFLSLPAPFGSFAQRSKPEIERPLDSIGIRYQADLIRHLADLHGPCHLRAKVV
jgi:hypothetical protein